jgi:hypothetical protein
MTVITKQKSGPTEKMLNGSGSGKMKGKVIVHSYSPLDPGSNGFKVPDWGHICQRQVRGLNSSTLHDGDEDPKIRSNREEGGEIWHRKGLRE